VQVNIRTSTHIQAADEGKRRTNLVLAWVVAFGLGVLVVLGAVQAVASALGAEDGNVASQIGELVGNAGTIVVVGLWIVLYERRSFRSVGFRGAGVGQFVGGFAGGVVLFSIPLVLLWLMGSYELGASEHTATGLSALLPVLLLIPVWLVQDTAEETVTRGFLFQRHGVVLRSWPAILVVSIGFAVVHLAFDPVVLTNIMLVGIFFNFLTLAYESIWVASGVHAGWNMAQGQIYGIPVSGIPRDYSLFDFGPAGEASVVLSGGDFGVEGSVIAIVVLVVACVWSYRYYLGIEATRGPATPTAESAA
jgi:membrane protease YdiL (CAAX protease family)